MEEQAQNSEPKPKKKLSKTAKIALTVLGVIFLLLVIDTAVHWQWYWWAYEAYTSDRQKLAEREKFVSEDIYGGDTPEETYNMFRDAMLKKDIDQALLYVDPYQRDLVKRFLDKKIQNNELDEYLEKDLPPIETMQKEIMDGYIRFRYLKEEATKFLNEDGETTRDGTITLAHYIELSQNYITKKWKILSPVVVP